MNYKNELRLQMIARSLVLIGALNWGAVALGINIVKSVFEKLSIGKYTNYAYVLVGLAAIYLLLQRDTHLPFLGTGVLPNSVISGKQIDADVKVTIDVPNNGDWERVVYWAADKETTDNKVPASTWQEAYGSYDNAGIIDITGPTVELTLHCPQQYRVKPHKRVLPRHVHYRFITKHGFMSSIHSVRVQC
jgi:uncharacterized membrane protein YuzA (DUF378 family)